MKKVEASGRTLEEAVEIAAKELGVSIDAIEYEVMERGSKGLLGLGQTPTRVEAWVIEGYVPAPKTAPSQETPSWETPVVEEETEEETEEEEIEAVAEVKTEAKEAAAPAEGTDAFTAAAMKILEDVTKAMGIDAKPVLTSSNEDEVNIEIVGNDASVLIGKQGQTLDALQYIVGIGACKNVISRARVIIEAKAYRERHKEMLEKLAREYADAVKAEGKEAVLEPQSARDRRIVHLSLADDPDVYTYSEGMGDDRHVVISPKK